MALRLIRTLPGERRLLSPLPSPHGQGRIDATVAAPGPPDFAVRGAGVRQVKLTSRRPASIAARAQRTVTVAIRPPGHGVSGLWQVLPKNGNHDLLRKTEEWDGSGFHAADPRFVIARSEATKQST